MAKFVINVDGEEVWSSVGDAMLVDQIRISNARGEVTVIGSHNQDEYLNIDVHERSYEAPETYLDMIESEKLQERRERFEPPSGERPKNDAPQEDGAVPEDEDLTIAPTSESESTPFPAEMASVGSSEQEATTPPEF